MIEFKTDIFKIVRSFGELLNGAQLDLLEETYYCSDLSIFNNDEIALALKKQFRSFGILLTNDQIEKLVDFVLKDEEGTSINTREYLEEIGVVQELKDLVTKFSEELEALFPNFEDNDSFNMFSQEVQDTLASLEEGIGIAIDILDQLGYRHFSRKRLSVFLTV